MQNKFLQLLGCSLIMPFLSAAQWSLTGNSGTTPGTHFIGTTDNKDLIFKTNSTERLTILGANGNMGVGIANPLEKLHVGGKMLIDTDWDAPLAFKNSDNSWQYVEFLGSSSRKGWLGIDQSNNFTIYKESGGQILFMGANVGIGTFSPRNNVEIIGNTRLSPTSSGSGFILEASGLNTANDYSNVRLIASSALGSAYLTTKLDNYGGAFSWARASASGDVVLMHIDATGGNVGIGTTTPQAKLAVNGDILAKKVKVTITGWPAWPDYVFDSAYSLRPLPDVEKFIKEHKHLPEVPAAKEVSESGLDLGENQAVLLKKIEELTLYMIEQEKKNRQQQEQIDALTKKIEELTKGRGRK